MKPCIDGIKSKLDQYYQSEIEKKPNVYVAATLLDPRLKLQYLKDHSKDWKRLKSMFIDDLESYDAHEEVSLHHHIPNSMCTNTCLLT